MKLEHTIGEITKCDEIDLPTVYGNFRMIAYKSTETQPHLAIMSGEISDGLVVRVHSECFTGDVLGSLRCDCGPQFEESLESIAKEGGILIYLRQEGRGIGLLEKLKAYTLQEKGFDTNEANLALGHPIDARDYTIAAYILKDLKLTYVKLMTNNPDKVKQLESSGIRVERIPLIITPNTYNKSYLETKREKNGHML